MAENVKVLVAVDLELLIAAAACMGMISRKLPQAISPQQAEEFHKQVTEDSIPVRSPEIALEVIREMWRKKEKVAAREMQLLDEEIGPTH